VKTVPHEEIVLRWTAALKEKFERLEGCTDKKTGEHKPGYVGKGIVAREDIYVVAVDGSRLSDHQRNTGISEFPYAVEAVFPLGPVAISIDPDGANPKVHRTLRYEVLNKNKRPVPTNIFLNPEYSGVSALLGCTGTRYGDLTELKMIVVHNPNAPVRLPKRFFGPNVTEYESTKLENGEYTWPSPIEDALPSP
jgi:type I restriction enzyme S subunit